MFRAFLRPSSGGQTALSLPIVFCPVKGTLYSKMHGHSNIKFHVQIYCLRSSTTSLTNLLPYFCCFHSLNFTYNMRTLFCLTACFTNTSLGSLRVIAGSAILTAIPICCVSGFMHLLKCIAFYISFLVTMH